MNTNKADKLRQCVILLNTIADALDDVQEHDNAELLDFIIRDLSLTIAFEENNSIPLIKYENGRFICEDLTERN